MRIFIKSSSIIFLIIFLFSCQQPSEDCGKVTYKIQKVADPNGVSELALLMRDLFAEAKQIKQQIADDTPLAFQLDQEKILSAHATEPEKAASPLYQAFGAAYLQSVKQLKAASPDHRIDLYDKMVDNCMNCHRALCPGPMVKIKQLQ